MKTKTGQRTDISTSHCEISLNQVLAHVGIAINDSSQPVTDKLLQKRSQSDEIDHDSKAKKARQISISFGLSDSDEES